MTKLTIVAAAACAALTTQANADVFVLPHLLEKSGVIDAPGGVGTIPAGQLSHIATVESLGPGENGEFFYLYAAPILFSGSDSLGRPYLLSFEVISAQTRPIGPEFITEYFVNPSLQIVMGGNPVTSIGAFSELTSIGSSPQPLGSAAVVFNVPAIHFDFDGRGSADFNAGTLTIAVPGPMTFALLGIAGAAGLRRRR